MTLLLPVPTLVFAFVASAKPPILPRAAKAPSLPRGPYTTGFVPSTGFYPTGTVVPNCSYFPTVTGTGTTFSPPPYNPSPTITASTSSTEPPPPSLPPTSTTTLQSTAPSTFKIQIFPSPDYADPGINGSYVTIQPSDDGPAYAADDDLDSMYLTSDPALAAVFTLTADHTLSYNDKIASNDPNAPGDPGGAYKFYLFVTEFYAVEHDSVRSVCSIDGEGYLHCVTGINDVDFTCGDQIESGPTGRPYEDFCFDVRLKTVLV